MTCGPRYAEPKTDVSLSDCSFYHTMKIPGYGRVNGEWELQPRKYLGGVDFREKRVLEVGTADGYLCFYMERLGADVVACDLPPDGSVDMVPMPRVDYEAFERDAKRHRQRLYNAFWLCHGAYRSRARLVYSSVYDLPEEIGRVDVSTFGTVLLHLRDPFLALQKALRLTSETVIVTDIAPWNDLPILGRRPVRLMGALKISPNILNLLNQSLVSLSWLKSPYLRFVPAYWLEFPMYTWWLYTPEAIKRLIGVLGFEDS